MSKALEKFKTSAELPPVIVLAGAETFLIDQHQQRVIDVGVPEDMRDFNLNVLYGAETRASAVLDQARAYPMMAERRLVVVRDFQKLPPGDLAQLAAYAAKPNPSTCLLLTASEFDSRKKALASLKKAGLFVDCKPLYENQVVEWIERTVRDRGLKINREAAALLGAQVGTGLQQLTNELDKIALFLGERESIESEDVARVAGFRKEFTVFALQNALGSGDIATAMRIYKNLRDRTTAHSILFQMARFFTNLTIASGFTQSPDNDRELARLTRTHSYFVRDLHKFKRRYPVDRLDNALENIRAADFILKTRTVPDHQIMQQLLIHIVKGYPARRLPFGGENK